MLLLDYVQPYELTGEAKKIVESTKEAHGKYALLHLSLANNPQLFVDRQKFRSDLWEDEHIEPRLKELAHVMVSLSNECEYCASGHSRTLVEEFDFSEEAVTAIREDDWDHFDQREKIVGMFAKQVAQDAKRVKTPISKSLKDAGFGDAAIIELIDVVAYAIKSNVLVDTLNIHPGDYDQYE